MVTLQDWIELSALLKRAKEEEVIARRELCQRLVGNQLGEFSVKGEIDGITVKVTSRVNRTLDKAVLAALWEDLTESEKECIDFKPALKLANYRKLSYDSTLHEAITEKPSETPTLEVLE